MKVFKVRFDPSGEWIGDSDMSFMKVFKVRLTTLYLEVVGLELGVSLVKLIDKIACKYPSVRVAYQDDVAKFKIWVYNGEEPVGHVDVDKHSLDVSSVLFKHEADLDILTYTFVNEIKWYLRLLTTSVVSDAGKGC